MKIKVFLVGLSIAVFGAGISASSVSAQSTDLSSIIASLQAQIASLLKQVQALQTAQDKPDKDETIHVDDQDQVVKEEVTCVVIGTRLFKYHTDDVTVTRLQQFLQSRPEAAWPEGVRATGFYGSVTEGAVKRFQKYHGVATYGSPETTGYGMVGPKTQAKIKELSCEGQIILRPTSILPVIGKPFVITMSDQHSSILGTNGDSIAFTKIAMSYCPAQIYPHISTDCGSPYLIFIFSGQAKETVQLALRVGDKENVGLFREYGFSISVLDFNNSNNVATVQLDWIKPTGTNRDPVIHSISGPTVTKVGVKETWKIIASDYEDGSLGYWITWGDESAYASAMAQTQGLGNAFEQTGTFEHAYNSPGTYTIIAQVSDDKGGMTKSTINVRVEGPAISNSPVISKLSVVSASIGQTIGVYGRGFSIMPDISEYPNNAGAPAPQPVDVYMDGLWAGAVVPTATGDYLSFVVPKTLGRTIYCITTPCPIAETRIVTQGVYDVTIRNANGTSNVATLLVIAESGSEIQVTSPTQNQILTRGFNEYVSWLHGNTSGQNYVVYVKGRDSAYQIGIATPSINSQKQSLRWSVGIDQWGRTIPDGTYYTRVCLTHPSISGKETDCAEGPEFYIATKASSVLIHSVFPSEGFVGSTVTINGTNLLDGAKNTSIRFDGGFEAANQTTLISGTDTKLVFRVPEMLRFICEGPPGTACITLAGKDTSEGIYEMTVKHSEGESSGWKFRVVEPDTVGSASTTNN